jgi:hypothetical protein
MKLPEEAISPPAFSASGINASNSGNLKTGWLLFSAQRSNLTGLRYEILCPDHKHKDFWGILQYS